MFPSTNTQTEVNIWLPLSFIIFSLLSFFAAILIFVFQTDSIINQVFRIPPIWMAAHLLVIGWALMVAMGVMYQMVPVAFLTSIWNEKLGFIQFWITAIGITSFSVMLGFFPKHSIYGGLLTFVGILLFFIQMLFTIRQQATKNIITLFVGTALVYLFLTITLGFILAWNLYHSFLGDYFYAILKSHIVFGLLGWFTLLIFGFSYKLVPMFSLSHGYSMKLSPYAFIAYNLGILITVISFFIDQPLVFQTGILLLTVGFSFFSWHMRDILKKRIKKKLDQSFKFALVGIVIGLIIHYVALLFSFHQSFSTFIPSLIMTYLIGWILVSIIGYLLKIIPFLWWTYKYSSDVGKANIPTLKEMVHEKGSNLLFRILSIALIGYSLYFITSFTALLWFSQIMVLLTAVTLIFNTTHILRR